MKRPASTQPSAPRPFAVGNVRLRPLGGRGSKTEEGKVRWYWRAERYVGGKSSTVWAGWGTSDEAMTTVARLVGGVPKATGQAGTIEDLLSEWVGEREASAEAGVISPKTLAAQRYAAEHLVGHLGTVLCNRVDRGTMDRYRDARLRGGAAPLTVRFEQTTLRAAWRWGRETGRCDGELPVTRVAFEHRRTRQTPSRGDVIAVLAQLTGWRRVCIELYAATGCRLREIADLKWAAIDLERGDLHVDGKTGPRLVPLPPPTVELLTEWRAGRADHPPERGVWGVTTDTAVCKVQMALTAACKAAGVPRFTTNGIRRAVVDQLYRAPGMDIAAAAKVVGHSPLTAMRTYRQVTDDDRRNVVQLARLGYLREGDVLDISTRRKR